MKKLFAILLTFGLLIPCYAFGIDIRKEGTVQHGGMRMPSLIRVSSDYDNSTITVNVQNYSGIIVSYVTDSKSNTVLSTADNILGKSSERLSTDSLLTGVYTLYIRLEILFIQDHSAY